MTSCVTRDFAGAAAACSTPPWLELDRRPTANAGFEVLVANAPTNAPGVLVFGTAIPFVPVLGANLGIALPAVLSPLLVSSSLGAQFTVVGVPPGITFPVSVGVQALWLDPMCTPGQDVVSSDRLGL